MLKIKKQNIETKKKHIHCIPPPHIKVYGNRSCGRNWGKGMYSENMEMFENEFKDVIRSEIEACDMIQGFQLFHSISGGTGGGTGMLP